MCLSRHEAEGRKISLFGYSEYRLRIGFRTPVRTIEPPGLHHSVGTVAARVSCTSGPAIACNYCSSLNGTKMARVGIRTYSSSSRRRFLNLLVLNLHVLGFIRDNAVRQEV